MKRTGICLTVVLLSLFGGLHQIHAQQCTGQILDGETGLPLSGASIIQIGTESGTTTDAEGRFRMTYSGAVQARFQASYLGYELLIWEGCGGNNSGDVFRMFPSAKMLGGTVVSASRFSEQQFTSPVTVHRLRQSDLREATSGSYYQELNGLPGVAVVQNSMAFQIFNTRGFNTTSPFRIVQWTDGVDNITPVLNFSPGGFCGPVALDLRDLEVLSGPSSALYGPNAMQGMLLGRTRTPFDDEGLAIEVQGGTRASVLTQLRWAQTFGHKKNFGVKLAASWARADEWVASDSLLNVYRPRTSPPQNLDNLSSQLLGSGSLSPEQQTLLEAFEAWSGVDAARPGVVRFPVPGYAESDLLPDPVARSLKINPGLYYRTSTGWNMHYLMRYSQSTGVYQGNNRAYLKNFALTQHILQVSKAGLTLKAYANTDQVGDSYDLVLSGISIAQQQVPNAAREYLFGYLEALETATGGFAEDASAEELTAAHDAGSGNAAASYAQPGSEAFQTLFDQTTSSTERPVGSRYISRSSIYHTEVQYQLPIQVVQFMVGGNFRRYQPRTEGRLFADTLMQNGEFRNIGFNEFGGFVQASKNWNNRWFLQGSVRLDKSENYDAQFSPRVSIGFQPVEGQHIRLSGQSAFRTPSLNDQYFLLNVGAFIVRGNVDGYDNLYTSSSIAAFLASGGTDTAALETISIPAVRPENLQMLEMGYRANLTRSWQLEAVGYAGFYRNFIGSIRAAEPLNGLAGTVEGQSDILSGQYQSYNIAANSQAEITTYGGTLSIGGPVLSGWMVQSSYTYADFRITEQADGLIPGFNTPRHRVVLSSEYRTPDDRWSFRGRWYWQDAFLWQSPFGDGDVPVNHALDGRIGYHIPAWHSRLGIGGTNLYNNSRRQAAGGPEIGSFYYLSWLFQWDYTD